MARRARLHGLALLCGLAAVGSSSCASRAPSASAFVMAFSEPEFPRVLELVRREQARASLELISRGSCALPHPCTKAWADVAGPAPGFVDSAPTTRPPPARGLAPLGHRANGAPEGLDWALDVVGVVIRPRDEPHELFVATRHGDQGGLERVVGWLEHLGGARRVVEGDSAHRASSK